MRTRRSLALAVALFMLGSLIGMTQLAWSQEVTASITGTVTDPSGAAVVGATVTATSEERGITYTAETNDSGLYRIAQLPVGTYSLKVEKSGFSSVVAPAFVLTLNQVARVDIAMKVGQTSETVEVTGAAPVMETDTTQVDTIINAATNDNLPLASRNYVQLTLLAPGAVSTDPSSFNNGNNTGGYGGRPLINGNREQANNFLLDGMDNNQVSDNLLGYTPAPDAIQEFNLITNNAPAEFGNFEGGIVNATIKSGTNAYHGDVWEFFRNDKLNANSWSNNLHQTNGAWDPLPKQKLRWNMFGGTFGGPIIKNKLFFFADFQDQRFDVPSSAVANTVFTAAERQGDFSAVGVQLYNPCASFTAPCTSSSAPATTRQPFVNNQIPMAMISPVASALFASSLYPSPVGTGLQSNAVNVVTSAQNNYAGISFIDDDTVILERQYRYPKRRHFIEIPAGKLEPYEDALVTAKRELVEECGYEARDWWHIATLDPTIGYSNEVIELYGARNLVHVGAKLDEGEYLECFTAKLDDALDWVHQGIITDSKTTFALLWWKQWGRSGK